MDLTGQAASSTIGARAMAPRLFGQNTEKNMGKIMENDGNIIWMWVKMEDRCGTTDVNV